LGVKTPHWLREKRIFIVEMLHFPFVTKITTFNITKIHYYQYPNPHHKFLATTLCNAIECATECSTIIILAR